MDTYTGCHPGGEALTLEAAKACGWKEGDRILDVGCGGGESMLLLKKTLGVKPVGCDRDEGMLARARLLDADFKLRVTDGMSLDFPSLYFDGALLECSFSLMNRHDEMLNELYCVLKKGAKVAISDLYYINPDPDKAGEVYYEAKRILGTPREEGDCEKADEMPSPYLLDGMFVIDNLLHAIRETGFEITWKENWKETFKVLDERKAMLIDKDGAEWEYRKVSVEDAESVLNQPGYHDITL